MILARWQLWCVVAAAFVLGLLGIRAKWMADGEARLRAKVEAQRQAATQRAREIENEVEALDRDSLKRRASVWVRRPKG